MCTISAMAETPATSRPHGTVTAKHTRIATLTSVGLTALAAVVALMRLQPIWIPLALAAAGLTTAFVARRLGRAQHTSFDGRLSLLSALVSAFLLLYLIRLAWVALQLG